MAAIHITESVIITILTILYVAVSSLRIRPYTDFHYPPMILIFNFEWVKNKSAESEAINNCYFFPVKCKIF